VRKGPQHNSDAKMSAHHDGNHPHHRADGPTASHHNHDHRQRSGQPVTTGRTTVAHAHQHDEHAGHDKHAGHSVEMFRQKFWGTLLLSVPTIVWAPMIQEWFGYEAPGGPVASRWIHSGRRNRARWHERRQRIDDHWRVATRGQGSRCPRHRRNGERLRLSARRGHRHRRKDRARQHHAAGRPSANIALARTGARRPSGLRTHDCGQKNRSGPFMPAAGSR
jgi:hypothetical protein